MLNVIINEGIYDKEFVAKWVHGFDELKKRVQEYPVDKVAAITEVPADRDRRRGAPVRQGQARRHPVGRADRHVPGRHRGRARDHLPVVDHRQYRHPRRPGDRAAVLRRELVPVLERRDGSALRRRHGQAADREAHRRRQLPDGQELPRLGAARHGHRPDHDAASPTRSKAAWIQTANMVGGQAARAGIPLRGAEEARLRRGGGPVPQSDHAWRSPTSCCRRRPSRRRTASAPGGRRSAVIRKRVQVGECKSDWEINFELAKRFNPGRHEAVEDARRTCSTIASRPRA